MQTFDRALISAQPGDHSCFLTSNEGLIVDAAGVFALAGFQRHQPVRLILESGRLQEVERFLWGMDQNLSVLRRQGRFVTADAAVVADQILKSRPSLEETARRWIADLLGPPSPDGVPIRVFGEAVGLLALKGFFDEAARLEQVWTAVGRERPLVICCPYPREAYVGRPAERERTCSLHTAVLTR